MIRNLVLAGAAIAVAAAAQTRPRDPFVFRTVLRENTSTTAACTAENGCMNRLLAVLLNAQMTALYSTERGTLYLARNAVPQDGNLTYVHQDFGSRLQWPSSNAGTNLHRNVAAQPWELLQGGTPLTSRVAFKGFDLSGENQGTVTLKWEIISGSTVVRVRETPEFEAVGGNPGIRRGIQISGLGAGQSLRLSLSGQVRPETWTVAGDATLQGTAPVVLNITGNGTSLVTGSWQPN
jgi:hypothetical protein